ncbi:MAG: thioesterase family protein [Verrucomicrobiota bacterium]
MTESKPTSVSAFETVIFCDTDCGGVVSNVTYLRYIEKARCHLMEKLGMPLAEMSSTGRFPTVIRTEIDYLKPAVLGDRLEIKATLADTRKIRATCEFEISRQSADHEGLEILIKARQIVVIVEMPAGKPCKLPPSWLTSS